MADAMFANPLHEAFLAKYLLPGLHVVVTMVMNCTEFDLTNLA